MELQNKIIEELYKDEEIKEAVEEHIALSIAEALNEYRANAVKKFGKPGMKKNLPVQPDCFGKYVYNDTPPECRKCHFAKGCKGKSKTAKPEKKETK